MNTVIFFLALIPTLWEAWSDRKGESKQEKRKDFYRAAIGCVFASIVLWMLNYNPVTFLMMCVAWRVLVFDYLTHYFLKRHSESHSHINIWTYSGKTAWFDQLIGRIHWLIRLALRVLFFAGCSWFYFR